MRHVLPVVLSRVTVEVFERDPFARSPSTIGVLAGVGLLTLALASPVA
jgi:hypothetical protein